MTTHLKTKRVALIFTVIILVLSTLWTGGAFAQVSNGNPFFENATIPTGPNSGKQIGSKIMRTFVNLDGTEFEKHLGSKLNYFLIGNIVHNQNLYIGRVPTNGGIKTSLVFDYFTKMNTTANVMVMMEFSDAQPVELIATVPTMEEMRNGSRGMPLTKPILLKQLLYSAEATAIAGDEFNAKGGLNEEFGITHRLVTLNNRMQDTINDNRGKFLVSELDLDSLKRALVLYRAMFMANQDRMDSMYNTLNNNCVDKSLAAVGIDLSNRDNIVSEVVRLFPARTKVRLKNPLRKGPHITKSYELERTVVEPIQ